MGKVKLTILIIFAIVIATVATMYTNVKSEYYEAQNIYRVYLNGKSIGLVKDKEELVNYINQQQDSIKSKYSVDNVYAPLGLSIEPETTYNETINSADNIYDKIKEEEDFTIDGYIMTITNNTTVTDEFGNEQTTSDQKKVYTLYKDIIGEAIDEVVLAFINKEDYNNYLNATQTQIYDTGTIIENVYLGSTITITEARIPANEIIFTTSELLARYLLFGTTDLQSTYTVAQGDTVKSIADAHQLNVNELLVANQDITSETSLLYAGQQLVVSLINPQITVVEETHNVNYQTINFQTITKEDSSMYRGESSVETEGVNGQSLLTTKVQIANGQIRQVVTVNEKTITPPVNRVVVQGTKVYGGGPANIGNTNWVWPTISGYTLTDGYGWRWGRLHAAQDIAGLGCNSPIYAAQAGTVVDSSYDWSLGNNIKINHNNGYQTLYAHLSKRYVTIGENVGAGQLIGLMGNTGESYGCHLHFGASYNGSSFDSMELYR